MKKLATKSIISWTLYDFADTAFSALVISFFFPILIKQYLGGTEFQIGLAMGLSLLAAALFVPLIGAFSDALGRRMPILIISTLITVALIASTGYVGLTAALFLGFLARFFNAIDVDLYDSFIPDLAPPEKRGRLSGWGTGVGYLGAIASLAMGYTVLSYYGFDSLAGIQAIFPATAFFFLLFSLPMFFRVKDRPKKKISFSQAGRKAFKEVKFTLTNIKSMGGLGSFLLSSFIYNDAMHTVIIFLSLFATERIGLSIQDFFGVFAVMALAAFFGSLIFGAISDRFGPKRTLVFLLLIWVGVIVVLLFVTNFGTFLLAGSLGGAALGGVWTVNRHMVILLSPPHKIAEIFGFEGLTEKVAAVIGPIGFGYLATVYGFTAGLIFVLGLLLLGLFILVRYVRL